MKTFIPALLAASAAFLLSGCNDSKSVASEANATAAPQTDEQEITAFCNKIAAEIVANPSNDAPLYKLRQKHLEEEWSFSDVDRICSDAVARKSNLMRGN